MVHAASNAGANGIGIFVTLAVSAVGVVAVFLFYTAVREVLFVTVIRVGSRVGEGLLYLLRAVGLLAPEARLTGFAGTVVGIVVVFCLIGLLLAVIAVI